MSRNKLPPRTQRIVRLDDELYAELILLKPQMRTVEGYTRHGAWNNYIVNLIRADLARVKDRIRREALKQELQQ